MNCPNMNLSRYPICTVTPEWSEIPDSCSACEYRQFVMRGIKEGVANATPARWTPKPPATEVTVTHSLTRSSTTYL